MSPRAESPRTAERASLREVTLPPMAAGARRAPIEARFPPFESVGGPPVAESIDRFAALRVAAVGAGSIGYAEIRAIARHQPAGITIIDPARIKPESLVTHDVLADSLGARKATLAGLAAKRISPGTEVFVFDGPIQALGEDALADIDVVLLASDNLAAEVHTGQVCINLGIPLIQASLHGEGLVVQVRAFENRTGSGPCPACAYGAAEWDHVARESEFRCAGAGGHPEEIRHVEPTVSTPALGMNAASLALVQLTRLVLGLGQSVVDTSVLYCGVSHRTMVWPLKRNPECPCEHQRFTRVAAPRRVSELGIRDLAAAAGIGPDPLPADLTLAVDDLVFVEATVCCADEPRPVGRFFPEYAVVGSCAQCSATLHAEGFFACRQVSGRLVDADSTLGELGAGAARYVVLRAGDAAYFIH